MKLTKTISKEFHKLLREEKVDTFEQSLEMLREYPALANAVVSGMAKGIDGFSSLTLAIRFYNFPIAVELIKAGADVNFIDKTPYRYYKVPAFFDLLESLKNCINAEKTALFEQGMKVWETMEAHGLDYSIKQPKTAISDSENCLQAFIRLVSTEYEYEHKIHNETTYEPPAPYESKFMLSEKSRDIEKEKGFELIAKKILNNVDEKLVGEIDANRYPGYSSAMMDYYEQIGNVHPFAVELVNRLVKEKYGYELKNINDFGPLKDELKRRSSATGKK